MDFKVYLVQQGISAATHPVTGKSGKLYGTATASPEHGGVMFMMSDQEYLKDAHDIIGNTSPHQQWVPLFVSGAAEAAFHKCNRCSDKAIARQGVYYFCGKHAPNDAVFFEAKPAELPPDPAQPPPPALDERVSSPIDERPTEAPKVTMPPPPIGTADEHTSDVIGPAGGPPKPAEAVSPPRPKLDPGEPSEPAPPAAPAPQPDKRNAVEVVTEKVLERIAPMLEEIKNLVGKNAKPTKAKKKVTVNPELVSLRARAKELKINTFGKSMAKLKDEIAAAETPPA